jgi:hypothetical protein
MWVRKRPTLLRELIGFIPSRLARGDRSIRSKSISVSTSLLAELPEIGNTRGEEPMPNSNPSPDVSTTSRKRQQLLILCSSSPDLASQIVAWSFYDGAGDRTTMAGDTDAPPYASVLDAMRDGWRVVQLPQTSPPLPGNEYRPAFLKWEYALERIVELP